MKPATRALARAGLPPARVGFGPPEESDALATPAEGHNGDGPVMKVGEMIFALVFPAWIAASAWWSWRFQNRALAVVHRSSPRAHGQALRSPSPALPIAQAEVAGVAPSAIAVGQRDRSPAHLCTSVLGWDAFTLRSALAFGGTALLSCQRRDTVAETADKEELTLVLLIGEDQRADQALALLQTWQTRQTTLKVRPTQVAGAIEVFANRHDALRAGLLVA
jgi:hypothetical protein